MDPTSFLYILAFALLFVLSAFFSASETAFLSLTKSTLDKFSNSKKSTERQVAALMKHPRRLLIAIIIGNTIANVSIASIAAIVTTRWSRASGLNELLILLLNVIVVTGVILFFSEIIPKVTAIKNARRMSVVFVYPMAFFYYLFQPVSILFDGMSRALSKPIGVSKDKFSLTESELRTLVDVGEEKGALKKDEKEMIHSIFEMSETVTREIMVPRTDMVCIEKDASLSQVLSLVKENLHSRIPVYDQTVDNILGILYLKDLLPFIRRRKTDSFDLGKLVHAAYYVPEQKKINELLREFQRERIHMAIVVDEYGGTSGLVTLEDVIEEIVGEIQDEYDKEAPLFEQVNANSFLVDASMQIDELNEELGLDLPAEEGVDTLAGFLLGQFGAVPKSRQRLDFNGYEFIIEKATKKRIEKVKIIRKKQAPSEN